MTKAFLKYFRHFEKALKKSIPSFGVKNQLRDAVEYSLFSGGKRLRPIIVLMVGEALKKGFDVTYSALSVEFFHTASLIADDLPSMDDDIQRRDKPTLHKAFPESVAILASYTLISSGYEMLFKNAQRLIETKKTSERMSNSLCAEALKEVSYIAGINGATGGQFLDLFPPKFNEKTIFKIIEKKTVVLFELAFTLGFLFGGGDRKKLKEVKACARHLGFAFQLADDLLDQEQDRKNEKQFKNQKKEKGNNTDKIKNKDKAKNKNNQSLNLALFWGQKKTTLFFHKEIKNFQVKIKKLGLDTPALNSLALSIKGLI